MVEIIYNKRKYKVHQGARGGHFIKVKGEKKYINLKERIASMKKKTTSGKKKTTSGKKTSKKKPVKRKIMKGGGGVEISLDDFNIFPETEHAFQCKYIYYLTKTDCIRYKGIEEEVPKELKKRAPPPFSGEKYKFSTPTEDIHNKLNLAATVLRFEVLSKKRQDGLKLTPNEHNKLGRVTASLQELKEEGLLSEQDYTNSLSFAEEIITRIKNLKERQENAEFHQQLLYRSRMAKMELNKLEQSSN